MTIGDEEYILVSPSCKACIKKMEYKDINDPSKDITLTAPQHKTLAYIIQLDGEPATYDNILIEIGSSDSANNYVNKIVSAIGKKIPGVFILPIRSVGYKWNPPTEDHKRKETCTGQRTIGSENTKSNNVRLKRFSLQNNLFTNEKKKSPDIIYIEELLDQIVVANQDDNYEEIIELIKVKIDSIVKDWMGTAKIENMDIITMAETTKRAQEEVEQIIRITDNRIRLREKDEFDVMKRNMIDALQIYLLIRFCQLASSYGSFLLDQALFQIEKEASKIKEVIAFKNIQIDKLAVLLEQKENEIEQAMIKIYGGNII